MKQGKRIGLFLLALILLAVFPGLAEAESPAQPSIERLVI